MGWTETLIVITNAVDAADKSLLPGTFRTLEVDLQLDPKSLAGLVMLENVVQALCTPGWGYVADRYPRKPLLVAACCWWGLTTCLVGSVASFSGLLFWRVASAAALASMMPISQAVLTELVEPDKRGDAFGRLGFWSGIGAMLGGSLATAFSSHTLELPGLLGQPTIVRGWRLVFWGTGLGSLGLAGLISRLMPAQPVSAVKGPEYSIWELSQEVLATKTWLLLVAQGMIGNIPWVAFGAFARLFFQYLGYDDWTVAALFVVHGIAGAVGQWLGGKIGDAAASRSSAHGRVCVAQASVLAGMVATVLLFEIPTGAASVGIALMYAAAMGLMPLVASWTPAGTLRPIVADISNKSTRGIVLGYWLAIEGCASAIGAPAVASLSQDYFGYVASDKPIPQMDEAIRAANAAALGRALWYMMVVPWLVCFVFFSAMHVTYPRDRKRMPLAI